ncbi:major facilitator family transporter [Streptantibioticus cattleyicolor NRRL 8057 = DSM 46488]|uniref:Putative proline/betaine transporter n=1 Tax=Streptantibioticus cattleyicolor (strain ATCC 35852 / DSM 46488 / JCM 4925 / NBRC 14057 / NRRL 8057) TaxID=1003195 RepID=G8X1V0_STREN|nr:major facilitator family transporter [Streptantibioticus cattleyicolor NRRL 8057 = DSM 46488]
MPSVIEDVAPQEAATGGAESLRRVAVASFVGTAIEFYDFYIYGTAAALVLNHAFFPNLSPLNATLASFSTYAVAFVARPVGSVLFGHFGDRVGRKSVLVVSLLLMGLSTALVGALPGYGTWGAAAPVLLVVLRFTQGIGLGGEWGGAALLAVEHAPGRRRGLYAAFPQLGPSVGFFAATGIFWVLSGCLSDAAFTSWGWRIPFLLSFVLVAVGLFVRLKISETPVFARAMAANEAGRVPVADVLRRHPRELLLGAGGMVVAYGLFYTATTYCLAYATGTLKLARGTMLGLSMVACVFLAAGTWLAATRSDRAGRRTLVLAGSGAAAIWGLVLFPLLDTKQPLLVAVAIGGALFLMGVIYGPMGAFLPELFSTHVRYSGASLAYNLGGVLGGSVAPLVSTRLQAAYGSHAVGWYLTAMALVSVGCVLALPETREREL